MGRRERGGGRVPLTAGESSRGLVVRPLQKLGIKRIREVLAGVRETGGSGYLQKGLVLLRTSLSIPGEYYII